ncbi:MAG: Rieske (2Fe-2S) protein [Planctomycetaceae bacterium]|nr:Rieske (2Fe-2S) protein [Planctomycetaceae bacterium]
MPANFPLIAIAQVPPGSAQEVVAEGRIFAVYNVNGTYHVLDGICPHSGGPLGKGALKGCIVTCPWHGWQFDVSTGQHCLNSQLQQPRFETEVADGLLRAIIPD